MAVLFCSPPIFFSVYLDYNHMEAVPVELLQLPNLETYVLSLFVCYLLYLSSRYTNRSGLGDNRITAVPPVVDEDDMVEDVSVSF